MPRVGTFIQRVDDVVWNQEEHDVHGTVRRLLREEMRWSLFPTRIYEGKAWARSMAAEHDAKRLKIKLIAAGLPEPVEAVTVLHDHHLGLSLRYTLAARACTD